MYKVIYYIIYFIYLILYILCTNCINLQQPSVSETFRNSDIALYILMIIRHSTAANFTQCW